ncbi:MAG: secondary thiamine-phosphate synthase enzyme YjbQ [Acidobacteriota bacterium]|nr:secondary thiamine-phosphate synthase enzyme YjbQ [Acidobacteriota bacterium]
MHRMGLTVETNGAGFYELTDKVNAAVRRFGVSDGLAVVFVRHTSASLLIQEGADPKVLDDLASFFARIVPENEPWYTHTAEGPDDMPSHIRSALTHTSEVIPVAQGRLALGTWQQLFLFEHRRSPHQRHVLVFVTGD